jgi:hypothetical protein
MDAAEKIKRCLDRHPDWDLRRVSSATGFPYAAIEAARKGAPAPEAPAFASVSLMAVRDRLDVAAMIRRQIGAVPKGQLIPEDELCRLTAGRDRNRFRRAVENNPDLARQHRVRLRLDDSTDGKFYWGHETDIQEAVRLRDL